MPSMFRTFTIAAASALLAACATTRMEAQWKNPDYSARNVRGAPVLIACEAQDLTLQRVCEDRLSAAVLARGLKPTLNSQLTAQAGAPAGNDPYLAAAKRAGAVAIVRMTVSTGQPVGIDSGPSIGIGIGGGSGRVGGGAGVGFPIGGSRVALAYAAETALIDATNGATMWSGRASSSSGSTAGEQISDLAQTTVEALQGTGLL